MNRAAAIALALLVTTAVSARAQTDSAAAPAEPSTAEFLSRFDFHVGIEHLSSSDPRFEWDGQWGAELDFIDYGRGALTFYATYQTILGDEFREFDPNQGNYTLGSSASVRAGGVDIAGVFHHVSRHLGDRPKRFAIDWNMIGGRVRSRGVRGRTELSGQVDVRGVIKRSFVDYKWEAEGQGRAQVQLTPRVALVALGVYRVVGVDGSQGRGTQHGWRSDGGVRFEGGAAAVELFVAGERRIDPYQLEFSTATWLTTGFRLFRR